MRIGKVGLLFFGFFGCAADGAELNDSFTEPFLAAEARIRALGMTAYESEGS